VLTYLESINKNNDDVQWTCDCDNCILLFESVSSAVNFVAGGCRFARTVLGGCSRLQSNEV